MDAIDLGLRLIGAFYAFAGYVATRAGLTSHLIDRAIAAISAKKPTAIENAQAVWLLAAAALVLAGGIALMLLLDAAVWLFVASALGQALYIGYVAPKFFDAADPPDPNGRRQTTNAFVIYAAATALVIWADFSGRLKSWEQVPAPLLALAAAAVLAHVAYAAWMFLRPLQSRSDE